MSAQPEDFRDAKQGSPPIQRAQLGTNVRPTIHGPAPTVGTSAGTDFPQATARPLPKVGTPAGTDFQQLKSNPSPTLVAAAGTNVLTASILSSTPKVAATPWGLLSLLAETLDDLERTRIAAENRARALAQVYDLDGEPAHIQAAALAEAIEALEHGAELQLKRALRKHPLGAWVKRTVGVGEKQGARLLAAIGDPYWNSLHDRPRTVSELWAYCGYHVLPVRHGTLDDQAGPAGGGQVSDYDHPADGTPFRIVVVAARKRRGERANWSATAKMRAYLVAESCMKSGGEYRAVYDEGRFKYADATHATECAQCGPKGKPAAVGSALSDGHKHARALRLVAKELLKDLWREARDLHAT